MLLKIARPRISLARYTRSSFCSSAAHERSEAREASRKRIKLQRLEEKSRRRKFLAALKDCKDLGKLVQLHAEAAQTGDDTNVFVASALIGSYAKLGSVADARKVFDKLPQPDLVSWTALLAGYADRGDAQEVLRLFLRMQAQGCVPDARAFVLAAKACGALASSEQGTQLGGGKAVKAVALEQGMAIHAQAESAGCDKELFVGSMLVDMYTKCGSTLDARRVFDRMEGHDVVSWTALVLGYAESGEAEMALEVFSRARRRQGCEPNARTFLAVIKACASLAAKEEGTQVEGRLVKLKTLKRGMALHSQALGSGSCEFDAFVASTVVDMYGKCGSLVDARMTFDRIPFLDVVLWNALMRACAENNEERLTLELLRCMRSGGPSPDEQSFAVGLGACSSNAALETGKAIHSEICRDGVESDAVVANCLLDFYAKCGNMVDAHRILEANHRRTATWTSLIAGYSRQGDSKQVFELFHAMEDEGLEIDCVTLVCVLTACSHAGRVEQGKKLFQEMSSKHGITPGEEHYVCMVDMLGRANRLDEAVGLLERMPHRPSSVAWRAVLAACKKWKNVGLGKVAFESLLELGERDPATYDLMASIYGSSSSSSTKERTRSP
ncbi:pentatricopeptide repeat-containing protein At2g33680-like [Selaginella moellendorffii]|uniref:pentatricopeptide repeat-containing protein At2g33680-like n=1 Tax=Selaginella moellendorffii TaxID=88036 RepID=UPI000D1D0DC3|nr:pentatricopeptide repeat-containing protein At2g33680-like [Selaginella moellendorffii]XP_024534605.1 pentatricopeptide repeat-containing protein At2g33680-like [Selaginella moellendorffii]|eukprot:XP_024534604.1 pentatricopeptide repeat-containing protein At2g33680-like [Selaginella moellendorffii]